MTAGRIGFKLRTDRAVDHTELRARCFPDDGSEPFVISFFTFFIQPIEIEKVETIHSLFDAFIKAATNVLAEGAPMNQEPNQ